MSDIEDSKSEGVYIHYVLTVRDIFTPLSEPVMIASNRIIDIIDTMREFSLTGAMALGQYPRHSLYVIRKPEIEPSATPGFFLRYPYQDEGVVYIWSRRDGINLDDVQSDFEEQVVEFYFQDYLIRKHYDSSTETFRILESAWDSFLAKSVQGE